MPMHMSMHTFTHTYIQTNTDTHWLFFIDLIKQYDKEFIKERVGEVYLGMQFQRASVYKKRANVSVSS